MAGLPPRSVDSNLVQGLYYRPGEGRIFCVTIILGFLFKIKPNSGQARAVDMEQTVNQARTGDVKHTLLHALRQNLTQTYPALHPNPSGANDARCVGGGDMGDTG